MTEVRLFLFQFFSSKCNCNSMCSASFSCLLLIVIKNEKKIKKFKLIIKSATMVLFSDMLLALIICCYLTRFIYVIWNSTWKSSSGCTIAASKC